VSRKLLVGAVVAALIGIVPSGPSLAAAPPPQLGFVDAQALAANGPVVPADPTKVCGATDRRFLGELLNGNPLQYKVPYRLGDVVNGSVHPTDKLGKQIMVSGTVKGSVIGTGDFPFDHPFGADFNMDVNLDPAYAGISQVSGLPSTDPMHVELSEGMLPHTPAAPVGPATGQPWETMADAARANLQPEGIPQPGDRVLVMGRFVNDCGHLPFGTELHPISFMAWSHTDADTTVVHVFFAPYRETQSYNPDPAVANQVNDKSRLASKYTWPFPLNLIENILRVQDKGPAAYPSLDHLESWVLAEANTTSPSDWSVCAPPSASGNAVTVRYDFVTRPGVQISSTPDDATGCATMHTVLGSNVTPNPTPRVCPIPWDFLDEIASEESGVPNLDLKATFKSFEPPQFKSRIDPDPIMNCYDPVKVPSLPAKSVGQSVVVDASTEMPFYGRIEVSRATATPPTVPTIAPAARPPVPVNSGPAFTG